jgi:hypothetical protein
VDLDHVRVPTAARAVAPLVGASVVGLVLSLSATAETVVDTRWHSLNW